MAEDPGIVVWIHLALRRWRFLAGTALAAGALALIAGFLMPQTFKARTSVLPPHESTALDALRGLTGGAPIESALPYSAGVSRLNVYLGILDSDTVVRTLVERFGLQDHYKSSTLVRTVKKLRAKTIIQPTLQGIVEVSVEDRDPSLAADLANAYVEELDRVYRATRSGSSRRQREFLERRLATSRASLDSLEVVLADLQADRGITALGRDATEAALAAGDLMGSRLALGVRLQMLRDLGVTSSPMMGELMAEVRATDAEIARLPHLGVELARQLRDLRIEERLHEALAQQLESARLEEVRDTPVVEVLDRAVVPDRHVRPRKGLMAMAGTLAGFVLAFGWAAFTDPQA